jgi:3-oxoacyl-[acyl-carrier-protein] synthase-3
MVRRSIVAGCGSFMPDRVVTNQDLEKQIDTSDAWIRQRTGIAERRIAPEGTLTSDLATAAAERAMQAAGVTAGDIDLIVLATATPDESFPATATRVQARIGMTRGAAFDVQAVCSGFIYSLNLADNFIRLGQADTVLVIGAETFSRLLDWDDRATCVLFGDGAGAVVLKAGEGQGGPADRGILSSHIHSDGRHHDLLYANGGVSSTRTAGFVQMSGPEVFRHAVTNMADVLGEALAANGLTASEIDWLVPHQANRRILDATAQKLGLPAEKVVLTVDRHANTSAASIPLALAEAANDGRIRPGQLVAMEAMGAGFTWGASLVRW